MNLYKGQIVSVVELEHDTVYITIMTEWNELVSGSFVVDNRTKEQVRPAGFFPDTHNN